ncbi:EAL domain-containing protein [Dactylosporangium sp. AC04546]|uniref:putative bifunctional diguanylate cyclase/phosphodiesterase n=1 Tax=Dactylosporangium sp. AC04546 TaxID=2862460 RepID=UPI002E7C23DF|nr:EAL domain-containing protein [Dactylosporangium sp. AC04546]WVK86103.1 EAL domain-containing protein [Dactylosporangium sp. AC04546]
MTSGVGGAHRSRGRWLMASAPVTIAAAGVVLLGGPLAGLDAATAVVLAAAVAAALHGCWMFRLAAEARRDGRPGRVTGGIVALGAGLVGAAVCATAPEGQGAAAAAVLAYAGPAAGAALVGGLLLLPGVTSGGIGGGARRGLDGVCVALWKYLILLTLVLDLDGEPSAAVFVTCLLAVIGVTVAVVSGVRAPYPRWAAVTAAGGVALLVLGLAVLPLLPAGAAHRDAWLLAAGGLLVAGSVLLWAGACRSLATARLETAPARAVADGTLIGDPLLVAPVLAGGAAVLYTLFSRGRIGTEAMAIGAVAVFAVVLREVLEAATVRRFSGQLDAQVASFRSLVAGSTDVILVLDADLSVRWQSPAAARQFGLSEREVEGKPFVRLVHAEDAAAVRQSLGTAAAEPCRARFHDGFGAWRHVEFTVTDQRERPEVAGLVVHLRDVGERHELETSLQRTTRVDPLTGLANRAVLTRELTAGAGFLVTIGLDGFAGINDLHGPDVGDALLVEVAARIRSMIGGGDVAARIDGDEFAVFTRVDKVHAYTLATRLLGGLSEPYDPGTVVHLSAGIGLTPVGGGPEETVRRAGLALRRAKRSGRGRIEWHDEAVEEAYVRRATLEQHLPRAAERGEFDLAFHPVYDLVEGHPVGVEALLRWRHPRLGTIPPLETLAVARELGVTAAVHEWVLHRACRQLSLWQHEGYRLWMSVNVGCDDFVAPGFAERLSLALDSHQVEPADLVVELAEREVGADLGRLAEPLATVRSIGVRTALDGFGTGATSLGHLRRLPADLLKVDRSLFTVPAGSAGGIAPIIDVVVKLGQRLNVTVVAHGLEAEQHLHLVRSAGCRLGQGHYYGTPGPAERVEAALVRQRTW